MDKYKRIPLSIPTNDGIQRGEFTGYKNGIMYFSLYNGKVLRFNYRNGMKILKSNFVPL